MPLNFRSHNFFKPANDEKTTLSQEVIASLKSNIDFVAVGLAWTIYNATDCGLILSWAVGALVCMSGAQTLDKVEEMITAKPANRP
jgi:hypothetical protein